MVAKYYLSRGAVTDNVTQQCDRICTLFDLLNEDKRVLASNERL